MTPLQKLQLQQSELRQRMSGILSLETRSGDQQTELAGLTAKMGDLERQIRAAMSSEPQPVTVETRDRPEDRELRGLFGQSSIARYLMEAGMERPITGGPEHELRQALLGDAARPGLGLAGVVSPTVCATSGRSDKT